MTDQSVGPQGSGSQDVNSKATWSLIGGILSVTFCGVIVGIVVIILGWISVVLSVLVAIIVGITYAGN